MKNSQPKIKLSIISVNYNSCQLLLELIKSIKASVDVTFPYEIIVVDNGSTEDTTPLRNLKDITFIQSTNLGFSHGNNLGVKASKGEYVWFLNPDTSVEPDTISYMLNYMQSHPEVGIATPKLILPDGSFDKNGHRGFPTIWNSLTHFSGLDKLFPNSKLFAGYYLGYLPKNQACEVDVVGGSSLLVPRTVGDQIGWWDETYFMYGEDIEFAYQVKQLGLKVMFVPDVIIHHHHGASSGLKKTSSSITQADRETRLRSARATTSAMRIFYSRHQATRNFWLINKLVYADIWILEKLRTLKV